MKAREKYVYEYYIANWHNGAFGGESSTLYADYETAKKQLLSDYSSQHSLEEGASDYSSQHRLEKGTFKTLDYWDSEYARNLEEAPEVDSRMFEKPVLFIKTRTELVTLNFTERAIFKKEIK